MKKMDYVALEVGMKCTCGTPFEEFDIDVYRKCEHSQMRNTLPVFPYLPEFYLGACPNCGEEILAERSSVLVQEEFMSISPDVRLEVITAVHEYALKAQWSRQIAMSKDIYWSEMD